MITEKWQTRDEAFLRKVMNFLEKRIIKYSKSSKLPNYLDKP